MKSLIYYLLLGMVLVINNACENNTGNLCPDITIVPSINPNDTGDSYGFSSIALWGDCLELKVNYSGGCAQHDFDMRWDGSHAESWPVQVFLSLHHNDNDDPCDGLIFDHLLLYDLSHLQYEGANSLIINVVGDSKPLLYTYE
jgi:hypothetical protein